MLTDDQRDTIIYEIQEAEATWLANKCHKNSYLGMKLVLWQLRTPNKYWTMSDAKLINISRLMKEQEDFDFAGIKENSRGFGHIEPLQGANQ